MENPECALIIDTAMVGVIKKVVKEYMERMLRSFQTHRGIGSNERIDCPECGCWRGLEYKALGQTTIWRCLVKNCPFELPDEFAPPSPGQLREFYERKKLEARIEKFMSEEEIKKFL